MSDDKNELVASLAKLNEAVLAKLDGLEEYDLRRPMTPTGSNLLGIVKHLATVQGWYFGRTFDRPWAEPLPWTEDDEPNSDMYATATESSDYIRGLYQGSFAHATETFAAIDLDATGTVPWWPEERRHPTLRTVMLHMSVETARHAGHLDIIRELIDGQVGRFTGDGSIPPDAEIDWPTYVAKLDAEARAAG